MGAAPTLLQQDLNRGSLLGVAYRPTATTEARRREARGRIVRAARELVAEGGFGAAAVAAVAARAGVATGSVYRHFPSKADLFAEVFRTAAQHEVDAVRAAAETGGIGRRGRGVRAPRAGRAPDGLGADRRAGRPGGRGRAPRLPPGLRGRLPRAPDRPPPTPTSWPPPWWARWPRRSSAPSPPTSTPTRTRSSRASSPSSPPPPRSPSVSLLEHAPADVFAVTNQPPPLAPLNLFTSDAVLQEGVRREGGGWAAGRARRARRDLGRRAAARVGRAGQRAPAEAPGRRPLRPPPRRGRVPPGVAQAHGAELRGRPQQPALDRRGRRAAGRHVVRAAGGLVRRAGRGRPRLPDDHDLRRRPRAAPRPRPRRPLGAAADRRRLRRAARPRRREGLGQGRAWG